MKLIPAIDLMNGKCVRLLKGNFNESKEFKNDPLAQAKLWEKEGATSIHIVDLDAARTGKSLNDGFIKLISQSISIPIQIGGGIRSKERIEQLFSYGIDKVIMGTYAIENRNLIENLTKEFPGKIIIGIDANKGKVSTRGWLKQTNVIAKDLIRQLSNLSLSNFIVTDINTDGTLEGPNESFIMEILESTNLPIIASGGIGSISDLLSLTKFEKLGLDGVIVGKALYENKFTIKEAQSVLSSERLNDYPLDESYFA